MIISSQGPSRARRLTGTRLSIALLTVFVGLILSTHILCVDSDGNTSIWPANGAVLTGMLLLKGRDRWRFVVAALALNMTLSAMIHRSLSLHLLLAGLNFLLCGLAAGGMRRWCGAGLDLTRPRRMVTFMLVATGAAVVEATVGSLITTGRLVVHLDTWIQWVCSDSIGLVLVTPALLILLRQDWYKAPTVAGRIERWALPFACIAVVFATAAAPRTPLIFCLYPLMLWTAFRSSPAWLLTSLLAVAMVLTTLTTHGIGSLAYLGSSAPLLRQSMIQPFLATLILCTLLPSNFLREKRRVLARMSRLAHAARTASHAAIAANAAKSDFLANMSHEIRTPLNGVVAVADLLTRSGLPQRETEMAEIIRSSGDTLQRLLSDILDMARIESGKVTIETAPFHAGELVRAVSELSRLRCDEKGVAFTVEIAPEVDQFVVGDMVRVRQVVTNLLSNAVKFTQSGEVRLTSERLQDGRIRFSVQDTGVGFDMADKSKVLGRFEQADSSITRRFGGSGLGLSICANLAELMGGVLDCLSAPGEGALFWLELPLPPTAAPAPLASTFAPPEPSNESNDAPLRILVVDDHPTNRQVVRLMLDGLAELTCAEDGRQAVEASEVQSFDVILMDMQMPIMDGLTATRHIRQRERAQALLRTPIVMLSANALPEHVANAAAAGADLHLAKPFTPDALFSVLDAVLAPPDIAFAAA